MYCDKSKPQKAIQLSLIVEELSSGMVNKDGCKIVQSAQETSAVKNMIFLFVSFSL